MQHHCHTYFNQISNSCYHQFNSMFGLHFQFLNHGLPSLLELNVANNEISCLSAESLFKCRSLETLNVAGNPLCTIQDIKDVNACPKLKELILIDAMYGKCPVACLCDSRPMVVSAINNVCILNGKRITDDEVKITQVK